MNNSYSMTQILTAYRKLKKEIYYNSGNLFQRKMIAEFESYNLSEDPVRTFFGTFLRKRNNEKVGKYVNNNFALAKLNHLCNKLNEYNDNTDDYFSKLLNKIKVYSLPKSFEEIDDCDVNSNTDSKSSGVISKVKHFIKMPVELHVIEIMWMIRFGILLDNEVSDHSVGNRLLKSKNGNVKEDGSLFIPYISQYRKWRDGSIQTAINNHETGNSVSIINLDIENCFYSIQILPSEMKIFNSDDPLTTITLKILRKFSSLLKMKYGYEIKDDHFVLPIGLFMSNILCNWYLKELDQKIIEMKPLYYCRYVDDLSIVVTDEDGIHLEKNEYIKSLFSGVLSYSNKELHFKDVVLNNNKSEVFHYSKDRSLGSLKKYQIEIQKNSSEFRFLSSTEDLETRLFDSIYEMKHGDSIHQLKAIKGISATKYGISVYLSKTIDLYLNSISIDLNQIKELLLFFKGTNVFHLKSLWEKLFTLLVIINDCDSFIELFNEICSEINKIEVKGNYDIFEIRADLYDDLLIAVEMSTSLNYQFLVKNRTKLEIISNSNYMHINNLFSKRYGKFENQNIEDINNLFLIFVDSNMIRHHFVKYPLANYTKLNRYNYLTNSSSDMGKHNIDYYKYLLSPRRIKLYEIILFLLSSKLVKSEVSNKTLFENNNFIDEALDLLFLSNFKIKISDIDNKKLDSNIIQLIDNDYKEEIKKQIFKIRDISSNDNDILQVNIPSEFLDKPKIGLANIEICEKVVEDNIKNIKPIKTSDFKSIIRILDESVRQKCDFLIYPECSLNYNNLFSFCKKCLSKNVSVITGTEHLVINDIAYNFILTVLPIEINGESDLLPLIRVKNYYSPGEIDTITGYGYKFPKTEKSFFHLVNWRNIYFSTYYCFELANIVDRGLFKSKVDILFASELNKDTKYFSNIVESVCRDVHSYFVQSNTAQYGDSRITAPTKSEQMDIVKIKGGKNPTIISDYVDVKSLREFQLKTHSYQQKTNRVFKVTPPCYNSENVRKRISNEFFNNDEISHK